MSAVKLSDVVPEPTLSEKDLAKLKKTTLNLMGQDRQKLLVRFPFTGGFLMRLELVPVRDMRLRTAATDGTHIFMDVAFCSKLNSDERLFVMAHEAWHCVLMHMLRCQTRNPDKFNIATDMEVNRLLEKEGLKSPKWCLRPKDEWHDLSAEEIYEKLKGNRPKKSQPLQNAQSGSQSGSSRSSDKSETEGDGAGGQFDKHLYGGEADNDVDARGQVSGKSGKGNKGSETDPSGDGKPTGNGGGGGWPVQDQWGNVGFDKDFSPIIPKDLADKIREQIVAVAQQVQRTRGTIPEHLETIVKAALKPQIRWQEVLAQFVTSCYGGSRRWLPPNRRHVSQGLYLQSSRKESLRAAVAIDTSGSTTADLPQFFTELNSLLNTFGDYELTVIQCDAEVQNVEKYDAFNQFHTPEFKTYGHGGTDFNPPFEYIEEHSDIEPSCLIYITDGCAPEPKRKPPYPVLWLLTADGADPAPWGWKLRFKPTK